MLNAPSRAGLPTCAPTTQQSHIFRYTRIEVMAHHQQVFIQLTVWGRVGLVEEGEHWLHRKL